MDLKRYSSTLTAAKCLTAIAVFFVFATSSFGQEPSAQSNISWKQLEQLEARVNFLNKLSHGNSEEKRTALAEIRNSRTASESRLAVPLLADKDAIVRATAVGSVVFLPPSEASAALLPLFSDKAEIVRREVAYALGTVGDPSAVGALIQLLQRDKIIEVKGAATVALGQIGDAGAVDALLAVLQNNRPTDDNEFLRRACARSIGQIAQKLQTGRIDQVIPQNFLPEKFKQIDPPKYKDLAVQYPVFRPVTPFLIGILNSSKESDDTRREAAYALGTIGDISTKRALESKLASPDNYLVEIAREALLRLQLAEKLPN